MIQKGFEQCDAKGLKQRFDNLEEKQYNDADTHKMRLEMQPYFKTEKERTV